MAAASALFTASFGGEPAGVRSAPGRVNLIGEHVDYAGGICLPIALPQRTFTAVRPRSDGCCGSCRAGRQAVDRLSR